MARKTRGPSHDPTRGREEPGEPEEGRTPPTRPDDVPQVAERQAREEAPRRTPRREDPSHGTSFESPETIDPPPGGRR